MTRHPRSPGLHDRITLGLLAGSMILVLLGGIIVAAPAEAPAPTNVASLAPGAAPSLEPASAPRTERVVERLVSGHLADLSASDLDGPDHPTLEQAAVELSSKEQKKLSKLVKKMGKKEQKLADTEAQIASWEQQLADAEQELADAEAMEDDGDRAKAMKVAAKKLKKAQKKLAKLAKKAGKLESKLAGIVGKIDDIDPEFLAASADPTVPAGMQATGGVGFITFDWNDVSGASAYSLYTSDSPGVSPDTATIFETSQSTFTLTGLPVDTTVHAYVTATVDGLESAPSDEVSASTVAPQGADPTMRVFPSQLSFEAVQGGVNPGDESFLITNVGGGTLNWSASDDAGWLQFSPTSGSLASGQAATVTVSVNSAGLQPGAHAATISFSAPGATNDSQSMLVTLEIEVAPRIGLSANNLSFATIEGGPDPSGQNLVLTNDGGGTLTWSASDDASWLQLGTTSGSLNGGQSVTIAVNASATGLAAGIHTANIDVSAPGASNDPASVDVALTISQGAAPVIGLSASGFTFSGVEAGPNPPVQTLVISNAGTGTLAWTASENSSWLQLGATSGSLTTGQSASVNVSVNTSGINAGSYAANITVSAPGASNDSQTVSVALSVSQPVSPEIGLSASNVTFAAIQGAPNPSAQAVTLSNAGGGTLDWTASENTSWLTVGPSSGSLTAGQSQLLSVSVNVSGLAVGQYAAAISLGAPGAINDPQQIGVALTVSQSNGSITAQIAPSRTTGVAPLAVYFDASATNAGSTNQPFHELTYKWNFADPSSGTWGTTGRSKNTAIGPIAAHVFETPGNYTVSLTVLDNQGGADTKQVSISVSDPNVVFGGSDTVCISKNGNFAGAPAGALQITTSSFSQAMSHVGTGKRVLLRRGESWSTSSAVGINVPGPATIGAFGTGNKPSIACSGNMFVFSSGNHNFNDWRVMDLRFTGAGASILNGEGTMKRSTFLRLEMDNVDRAILMSMSTLDYYFHNGFPQTTMHEELAIVDCSAANSSNNTVMMDSRRLMFMGNDLRQSNAHVIRFSWIPHGVFSNNKVGFGGGSTHSLKLGAPYWDQSGLGFHQHTEKVVLTDNVFEGGNSNWVVVPGPQNSVADERMRDLVIERNRFRGGAGTTILLRLSGRNHTVRNNIFDCTGSSWGATGTWISGRGSDPAPADVRVYNNTYYMADGGAFEGVHVTSGSANCTVKNNLGSAPNANSPPIAMVVDEGSGTDASNNLLTSSPGFVSSNPSSSNDFQLGPNSPAIDAGVLVPGVVEDFGENPSPHDGDNSGTAEPDLGAFEF